MVAHDIIRKYSSLALILLVIVLAFFIIQPIIISIIGGLILAFMFNPIYLKIVKVVKEKNTSALLTGLIVILIIFIPIWFLVPILIQQVFDAFRAFQGFNVLSLIQQLLPTASAKVQADLSNAAITFINGISSSVLGALGNFLLDLPTFLLHFSVVIFVFFYTLRDQQKLKAFVTDLSPLKKDKEKLLVAQFRDITSSITYGYIIVGVLQGIATGIGLLIFGVPSPLLLTVFATIASIIPVVGPWLIWIPATIYLLSIGETTSAVLFALYSGLFVSSIDNIIRPFIVARRAAVSSIVVLVGMIGGLLFMGFMGIIIGPLILSYVIFFLEAYRKKMLSDLFD